MRSPSDLAAIALLEVLDDLGLVIERGELDASMTA